MNNNNQKIPDTTLETLARHFFKECIEFGFKKVDYIRFVNQLLDLSMNDAEPTKNIHNEIKFELSSKSFPLKGQRIWIRNCEAKRDKPLFEKWLLDESGKYFLSSRINAETLTYEQLIQDDAHILGIIIFPDGTPIGAVAYLDNNETQQKAELRKLIGDPNMRGMGLAKEATQLWIAYGLEVLNLKKIYVNTLNTNIRNIRLNEELGFKVEGLLRNEVFIDGEYRDVLRMGLWKESKQKKKP